ncbi:MAG: hypothetical protein LBQ56_07770, partial [Synergistaceae bacterium]|nr:hypothetical protein [Synergistaceae bacterium]
MCARGAAASHADSMIALHRYSKISELRNILRERARSSVRDRRVYMIPSMANGEILRDMLRDGCGWFGEGPEVWSWAEMYRRLAPKDALRRGIDLPDSGLILRYILGGSLADLDARGIAAPPGVRRRGFPDVLASAIRELLLEDVEPDRLLYDGTPESGGRIQPRELLYGIYTDYLAYLEENGLADNSQMPALTREAVEGTRPDCLDGGVMYWVGFLSFTGAQMKLIKSMMELGMRWGLDSDMEFFVPDPGLDGFRDAAKQLGLGACNVWTKGGLVLQMLSADTNGQYDGAAREIFELRSGAGRLNDVLWRELSR